MYGHKDPFFNRAAVGYIYGWAYGRMEIWTSIEDPRYGCRPAVKGLGSRVGRPGHYGHNMAMILDTKKGGFMG